ncbi:MAG TPA: tetratricopeptide repeat protein [Bryobacteraceae bacterium]|nr:tetratricopeptide repeat protein [Bryobacteraceae bacterium]
MDTARLQRIQALFLAASDLPEAERPEFVKGAAAGDQELMAEVLAMLAEDARGDSLLDSDVSEVAQRMLSADGPLMDREFGPYRLKKLLGEGGMGVVYLAERADLASLAAIKILRDAALSPLRRERFVREQRTLAQLSHPSIARLYDADTLADGTPWFAMEYVEGAPITDFCEQRSASIQERLRLFLAVCEAVQYAHEHAIIHRDLKPSNILVTQSGEVRLLDFGIAKQLETLDRPVDQTRTELRLMTPAYAAPEQVLGGQVGIFTDVYALGVILYELLAGQLPFDLSTRTHGQDEAAERPSSRTKLPDDKDAWADLDVLCLTAMHKDVPRRYRSVEALMRDVRHFLDGEPLEARPDTIGYRAGKFVKRHRAAVAVTAASFLIVAGLVTFFTIRLAIARNTAVTTAARLGRVQQFMLSLFQGGDPSAAPREGLQVKTIIDRGVKEARSLQQEPQVQAELYQTLGGIYEKLGDLPKADELLNAALAQRQSLFGPNHPEVAQSLIALGLLRTDQARLDDAERLIRDGLEKTKRSTPQDTMAIAKATTALGKVLEARGAYDKAIPMLQEAARLQSGPDAPSTELAATLKELADAHFYAGHYDLCEALTQSTLAIHRQTFGDRHPLVADDLINLGAVEFERARYADADRFYRQALDINEGWYGKENPEIASNLSMLGRALVFEKKYDEAVGMVERALAIQEHVYGPDHPKVANVLNELGTVALQRDHYEEAAARFSRMAEIYKKAYGERHYLYALANANLASVYLAEKDFPRAEQLFRRVVMLYTEALSPKHQFTAIAEIKLGRALAGEKRYAEAEQQILTGYDTLSKQTSPSASWLKSARESLVTIYSALNEPEKAAKYAANESRAVASAAK